jgi:hypothetical protein
MLMSPGALMAHFHTETCLRLETHMRLYLKLFALAALFVGLAAVQGDGKSCGIVADVRIAWISRYGSAADYDALLEEICQRQAFEQGDLELYLAIKRYNELLIGHSDAAAERGCSLTDDEVAALAAEARGEENAPEL